MFERYQHPKGVWLTRTQDFGDKWRSKWWDNPRIAFTPPMRKKTAGLIRPSFQDLINDHPMSYNPEHMKLVLQIVKQHPNKNQVMLDSITKKLNSLTGETYSQSDVATMISQLVENYQQKPTAGFFEQEIEKKMSNLQPGPLRDYYEQLLKAHRRSNMPSSNPNPLSLEDVENDFDEEEELTSDDGVVLDPEIAEQDNEVKYMNNCFAPKSKPRRADIPEVDPRLKEDIQEWAKIKDSYDPQIMKRRREKCEEVLKQLNGGTLMSPYFRELQNFYMGNGRNSEQRYTDVDMTTDYQRNLDNFLKNLIVKDKLQKKVRKFDNAEELFDLMCEFNLRNELSKDGKKGYPFNTEVIYRAIRKIFSDHESGKVYSMSYSFMKPSINKYISPCTFGAFDWKTAEPDKPAEGYLSDSEYTSENPDQEPRYLSSSDDFTLHSEEINDLLKKQQEQQEPIYISSNSDPSPSSDTIYISSSSSSSYKPLPSEVSNSRPRINRFEISSSYE